MPDELTLKRVIDLEEKSEITNGDYTLVDSVSGGAKKFALGVKLDTLSALIPQLDATLTQAGKAADAKAVGDELGDIGDEVTDTSNRVTSLQNGLPAMIDDQIDAKIGGSIADEVTSWLDENVDPVGSAVVVDNTLSISGAAADAKKTGDEISDLKDGLLQVYVDGTSLVINGGIPSGEDASY